MKVLGLTGGIGSGKSTIACIFKTLGTAIYNSDARAKELYFIPEIKIRVEKLLGPDAYKDATTLNKKYISDRIFSDKTLLGDLNAIIHPAVAADFEDFKKRHADDKYVIKEAALLLEAGMLNKLDKLLVITSPLALRIGRLKKRDGLNELEIEKIMQRQLQDTDKIKKADWVIENSEEELLIPQVLKIHRQLL